MLDPSTDRDLLALVEEYRTARANLEVARAKVEWAMAFREKADQEYAEADVAHRNVSQSLLARAVWPGFKATVGAGANIVLELGRG